MGTRHLIAVQKNGRYGIAQYGQWDGYPSGQGVDVLAFARGMEPEAFGRKVAATVHMDDAAIARVNATKDWQKVYPQCSRDAGSDILHIVNDAPEGIEVLDRINFAGNSLFCEYGYVIDLDAGTFEFYRGFNKDPVPEGERFANSPLDHDEYKQIRLVAKWPLDSLPTDAELIALDRSEDDE